MARSLFVLSTEDSNLAKFGPLRPVPASVPRWEPTLPPLGTCRFRCTHRYRVYYAGEQRHLAERQFGDVVSMRFAGYGISWENKKIDSTTLNTGADVTTTLTRSQSGTLFEVDGTGDIVVNMPALSQITRYNL